MKHKYTSYQQFTVEIMENSRLRLESNIMTVKKSLPYLTNRFY